MQLAVNVLDKVAEDGASTGTPAAYVGDPEDAPGSHLRLNSTLTIAAIWGVN